MNKLGRLLLLVFTLSFLSHSILIAQENDTTEAEININHMRLPFPASKEKKAEFYSLDDEAALIISQATRELGLYDLVVGIYFDSSSVAPASAIADFAILNFNEVTRFREAIIILATEIFQQAVPPVEDDAYFLIGESNLEKKSGNYSKNIQTQLLVNALFISIETGNSLGALELEVFHTGGTAKKSKARAMKLLKEKAKGELKRIYWFSADVIRTKKGMVGIPFGTKSRIKKGMTFELVEPDRTWELDGEEFLVTGGSAAIATVVDTSADSSGFEILRQWRDTYPGSWAVEHPASIFALGLNFAPPSIGSYSNLGICFQVGPLNSLDFGLGLQIIKVTDSYNEDDYGIGIGGFGIWRFINTSKIDFGGKLGIDLDIPFKKDDDGQTVHTILFSSYCGMLGEFLISRKLDFSITAGYRFGLKNDNWQYTEDEEDIPAYWEKDAPEVENSGLMLSFGFKYFLF